MKKIFNYIIILIITLIIIIYISPEPDSILFILQKHLNYFIYKIKIFLNKFNILCEKFDSFDNPTFNALPIFSNTTPEFKNTEEINFVNYLKKKNELIDIKKIYNFYNFIKSLVSKNTDPYFMTPSDPTTNFFNDVEKEKIKKIILYKLNLNNYKYIFSNFEYITEPKYYLNFNGKEIDSFIFKINSENFGPIKFYININIRNDIYQNKEYVIINNIKPMIDEDIIDYNIIINDKNTIEYNNFNGDTNLIW